VTMWRGSAKLRRIVREAAAPRGDVSLVRGLSVVTPM
jgi:hypothetical protein